MTDEGGGSWSSKATAPPRAACTFHLDKKLVDRARRMVSEADVVRSIEAALAAAIDYQLWVREVAEPND